MEFDFVPISLNHFEIWSDLSKSFTYSAGMINQCYICKKIFDSKEKLFEHLRVHSKPGLPSLSEEEVMEQFNATKNGESSRMSSR